MEGFFNPKKDFADLLSNVESLEKDFEAAFSKKTTVWDFFQFPNTEMSPEQMKVTAKTLFLLFPVLKKVLKKLDHMNLN